ncbi:MAG: hypothetical protein KJ710_00945 [Candidatus Omnitrophica bacterium]|nr:hypothetical protein [Candidatus Omnitrophota bacterium]MBU1922818.1 hypothetical protein [Candidatus Omnitrophota bacterium]
MKRIIAIVFFCPQGCFWQMCFVSGSRMAFIATDFSAKKEVAGLNYGVDLPGSCFAIFLTGIFLIHILGIA